MAGLGLGLSLVARPGGLGVVVGVWGQSPQWGPGAEPSPPEAEEF